MRNIIISEGVANECNILCYFLFWGGGVERNIHSVKRGCRIIGEYVGEDGGVS